MNIDNDNERADFSKRLQQCLRNVDIPSDSPTRLAREFNARFSGTPITVHAARKWLVGEAIPTQNKIRVLATWFGVTTEWLRFGAGECESGSAAQSIDLFAVNLVADIQRLGERDQLLVREFIRTMVRL